VRCQLSLALATCYCSDISSAVLRSMHRAPAQSSEIIKQLKIVLLELRIGLRHKFLPGKKGHG
jgi:hypothetical protein